MVKQLQKEGLLVHRPNSKIYEGEIKFFECISDYAYFIPDLSLWKHNPSWNEVKIQKSADDHQVPLQQVCY